MAGEETEASESTGVWGGGLGVIYLSVFVSLFSFAAMPAFVGAYIDFRGVDIADAGRIASAEAIAQAIGCAVATALLSRAGVNLRRVVLIGLLLQGAAQVISALAGDNAAFILARCVSGFCCSVVYVAASVYIASLKNPDRPYAIYFGILFATGSLGLLVLPFLFAQAGLNGVYLIYAALLALSGWFVGRYPKYALRKENGKSGARASFFSGLLRPSVIILLLALFLSFVCNGGVWTYAERIGLQTGASSERLGLALALAMGAGLIGTLIVSILGNRIGRLAPIVVNLVLLTGAMGWLYLGPGLLGFFGAATLFNIASAAVTPYVLAALAMWDSTGRAAVVGTFTYILGWALGPGVISFTLADARFTTAFILAGAGFMISALLTVIAFALQGSSKAEVLNG